jgi:hypothetical protein
MAQSNVYSLNVVGYVNTPVPDSSVGAVIICNPLSQATNDLNHIIPNPPDNTTIFRWDVAQQGLDGNTIPTYSAGSSSWIPNSIINPGEGFLIASGGGPFTNTFVGNVLQGALSIPVTGSGNGNLIGSMVPVAGGLKTNVLKDYAASDNDTVFLWDVNQQGLDGNTIPTYSAGSSSWIPEANIGVGIGFLLVRADAGITYTRNFTVQ